jgi:hypothetical protein
MTRQTYLVTGASNGIGAVYADRRAKRGHDLVLVARSAGKLGALAERLRKEAGVAVDVIAADLAAPEDLAWVESRFREDAAIAGLANNAVSIAVIPGPMSSIGANPVEFFRRARHPNEVIVH